MHLCGFSVFLRVPKRNLSSYTGFIKQQSPGEALIIQVNSIRNKSILAVATLFGVVVGGFWLPQIEWAWMVIPTAGGGLFLLALALRPRDLSTFSPEINRPGELPVQSDSATEAGCMLRFGFYLWLGSLAVGWRQLWITGNLRIHPAEVIIWGLFILLLLRRKPLTGAVPAGIKAFMFLAVLGFFTAHSRGIAWDVSLAEFKAFLIIIPIIYVTHQIISAPAHWQRSIRILAGVTFLISLFGVVEYFVPALIAPFQGILFTEQHIVYSQQGFARAAFTFWGSPIVNVFLSMILVPILSSARVEKNPAWRLFLLGTVVFCALGIYLAGGRSSWLGASAALALYVFLSAQKGWIKLLFLLLVAYNTLPYILPNEVVGSLYAAFDSQEFYDTSALERQARAEAGLELIQRNPWLGRGWGASGWVHSDLIQLGANLGLPALAIFLVWYLGRMRRVFIFTQRANHTWPAGREYGRGLLAGLLAGFISLAVQAAYVIPPLIIPLWFLVVMADRLPALQGNDNERMEQPLTEI